MPHIVCYPNEILKERSHEVIQQEDYKGMISHMMGVWSAIEDKALGLAAVQTGIPKRICIMKINDKATVMINPIITSTSGTYTAREYCFSVPGVSNMIESATDIELEYMNEEFEIVQGVMTGEEARVLQHEIRHMDGITIVDIGAMPQYLFEAKLKRLARKHKGLLYV